MKNLLFIIAFLIVGLSSFAKTSDKDLKRIIKKFDVSQEVLEIPNDDPTKFWRGIMATNPVFIEIKNAATNGKAKKTQQELSNMLAEIKTFSMPVLEDSVSLAYVDSLEATSGIRDIFRQARVNLYYSDEENAFVLPDGGMYISLGLLFRFNGDFELLMAAYAHEISHFVLQHKFAQLYFENKKRKKNALIAGIAAGFMATATAASNYYAASNGVQVDWNSSNRNVERATADIFSSAERSSAKFSMKYSREQEFEADIIGYYFMEWLGFGGEKYIEMLRLISSEFEIFHNDESTHPLTEDRIRLLEMLPANHGLKKPRHWTMDELKSDDLYN